jgi:hypothetical protein
MSFVGIGAAAPFILKKQYKKTGVDLDQPEMSSYAKNQLQNITDDSLKSSDQIINQELSGVKQAGMAENPQGLMLGGDNETLALQEAINRKAGSKLQGALARQIEEAKLKAPIQRMQNMAQASQVLGQAQQINMQREMKLYQARMQRRAAKNQILASLIGIPVQIAVSSAIAKSANNQQSNAFVEQQSDLQPIEASINTNRGMS